MLTQNNQKSTVFSGIQPSGELTIGSYIGAVQSWIGMQESYHCLFMLADLHTLTVKQDPELLRKRCYDLLALYIACGIDPDRNILFAQSHVPAHTQLAWLLNCYTYMGELQRMTQFKGKSKQHASNINIGLFDYPVLMAADVLLYASDLVPVGDDQKQHLELVRNLALRFNQQYGPIFKVPELFIPLQGARIMSLQIPTQKMSKSDPNPLAYIALLDEPDLIRQKLKRAVTDSGSEIRFTAEKPGISNLLTLLSVLIQQPIAVLEDRYQTTGYGTFKQAVADALIAHLQPIQQRYYQLRSDQTTLQNLLKKGAQIANERARQVLNRVYEAIGLVALY